MSKLIKLTENHYIIVDESIQPVNGYYYDSFVKKIYNTSGAEYGEANHCLQITHSTQSLEVIAWKGKTHLHMDEYHFDKIQKISLQEVKELIGEVDVSKKAAEYANSRRIRFGDDFNDGVCNGLEEGYSLGYTQALEDNKEKKYTENQAKQIWKAGQEYWKTSGASITFEELTERMIKQPKTEWDVEIVDGKLKLK